MSFDTILARGDILLESNMWRESFLQRHCLVSVDSFIEWEHPERGRKEEGSGGFSPTDQSKLKRN
jgi:putative SOS response-associated peptidase YedK